MAEAIACPNVPTQKGLWLDVNLNLFDNDTAENVGVKIPVSSFFSFFQKTLYNYLICILVLGTLNNHSECFVPSLLAKQF